jgi:hypothetical protein
MHPRTLVLLLILILGGAFALRFLVVRFGLLPVSEEAVLRRASAVTVSYSVRPGVVETQTIDDPRELRELLGTIRIENDEYYTTSGVSGTTGVVVTFHYPSGQQMLNVDSPDKLSNYKVDRAFYDTLNRILSDRKGQPVDLLNDHPQNHNPLRPRRPNNQ